jgi:alpha(1,3/1,4) fucosyltransferase
MRKIRIDFCDFAQNYSKTDNYLFKLLSERFAVELCDQPDFLIYNCAGLEHRLHSGVRIFYCWESDMPDYSKCDYSITSVKLDDPRHLQWSHYPVYGEAAEIVKQNDDPLQILAAKKKFCSFIVSGYNPRKNRNRVEFFQRLSKYKQVDSGGRKFNNIGAPVPVEARGKVNFLRQYKFNIAFENRSLPGYTTEKIFEPMVARCLPIYWGNPEIAAEFNPKSFLNYFDFPSEEALIEKIIELDQDDAKYLEYVRQPYFHGDQPNIHFSRERTLNFFEKIFSQKIQPVAQRKKRSFFFGRWIPVKRHHWQPVQPPTWS